MRKCKCVALLLACLLLVQTALAGSVYAEEKAEDSGLNMEFKSAAVVLVEKSTGTVLFEKNSHEKRPIASVTKIMTMLLTMEAIDSGALSFDDIVTVSERAKSMGGSTIYLETGEQMTVRDILKGIAVMSANDGCVAIAEHIAGSEEEFINMMNHRAAELGMNDTHFSCTNGLDDENNYSSAYDVALMSRELLKHEKITEFTTIWMDSLRNGTFELANTNKLIKYYDGATGLKTGFTSKAMYCVSASAKRNNMEFVAVILGGPTSQDRFSEAMRLLDYGFNGFTMKEGVKGGEEIANIALQKGVVDHVVGVSERDFGMLVKKNEKSELTYEINLDPNLTAPINKGDKIGEMDFYIAGNKVGTVSILANDSVEKQNFFFVFKKLLQCWVNDQA